MANVRNGVHTSRDQETRDSIPIHMDSISFEDEGPLPDIPARAGYAQRWVRVKKGRDEDARNIYNSTRKGWLPRAVETVSKALQGLTVQREGFGGVIGSHDMVLMERHEGIDKASADHKKQARRNLTTAVKENLFSEHRSLGGSNTGLGSPGFEDRAQVERGRRVSVADD